MKYVLSLLLVLVCIGLYGQQVGPFNSFFRVNSIHVSGNKVTKTAIITRELSVSEGQIINPDSLPFLVNENILRLNNLALFTDVSITIDTISASGIDWNILVKERWYIWPEFSFQLADRNFNVWWNEQGRDIRRSVIGLTLRHRNFRGNLENLSVSGQIGYTQKFYLDYQRPYVDKNQKHGIGFSFGASQSQETFYTTDSNKLKFIRTSDQYIWRMYEGALLYTYRPAYFTKHILRLSYKDYLLADTVLSLNPDFYEGGSRSLKMLELNYRFDLNKVDNWNYPLKGTKLVVQVYSRIGFEGLNFQTYATVEAGNFQNPWPKWFTALIFRGRFMVPNKLPYAFRSSLGTKTEYVRGYEYYVIDGYHHAILRASLKREILNITIRNLPFKYLPVLPIRLYPKIFADAGYTNNDEPGNSFLNNRLLYSGGVGIDLVTAYDIKLRFEYAINHLGQKDIFLHGKSE